MTIYPESFLRRILAITAILATVAVSPWISYDPINLPKMLIVVTGAALLLGTFFMIGINLIGELPRVYLYLSIFFALALIYSIFVNESPWSQQLWGAWGRSTGLLTYFSLVVLMLSASMMKTEKSVESIRSYFEKLSYFISLYTLFQAGGIDPINWSQKAMIATLGNINFMSSFLGLATVSIISRLVNGKLPMSSYLYFCLVSTLNIWLIWLSGSIQGLGIILCGVSVIAALRVRVRYGFRFAIGLSIAIIPLGLLVFLGTAGVGPLRAMFQETVGFRVDYWKAGYRMLLANWQHGIGVDSYGDYYQQYRDISAVTSTGPQRVTNTAHNIFLDVATGSGIMSGIILLSIFAITAHLILKNFKSGNYDETDIALASIWVGFLFFCLISINQIGVGVWGFVFMGLIHNKSFSKIDNRNSPKQLSHKRKSETNLLENHTYVAKHKFLAVVFAGLLGFSVSALPNYLDIEMLQAVKSRDFSKMMKVAQSPFSTVFYKDKLQSLLIDSGMDDEALSFAWKEIKKNERNYVALKVIAFSEKASSQQRTLAISKLRMIDPLNSDLMQQLDTFESYRD
jgi:hypothetical protein